MIEPDTHPVTSPHGLDREAGAALPGLWYFLHLPRGFAEVVDLPCQVMCAMADVRPDHRILLAPVEAFDGGHLPSWPPPGLFPVLMAAPDELMPDAMRICSNFQFLLPPISFGAMSDATLDAHWVAIHQQVLPDMPYIGGSLSLSVRLDLAVTELAVRRQSRQLGRPVDGLPNAEESPISWLEECLTQHALMRAVAKLEVANVGNAEAATMLHERVVEEQATLRIPITFAAPGVAAPYLRNAPGRVRRRQRLESFDKESVLSPDIGTQPDDLVERAAIEFLATHSGVRDGFALMMPTVPSALFSAFSNLEEHWARGPDARTVRRLLGRLDDIAAPMWADAVVSGVQRASQLVVFSNFPLGVLRVPGDTAPLSCRLPIAYRPLLPLTRAIQNELSSPIVDLSGGFRVLVAECIPNDDPVGLVARSAWDVGSELFDQEAARGSTLVHAETPSLLDVKSAIADVNPDVLVLSAHGASNGRVAGVVIGDELCLGPELGRVPPVVVLSACHAAARGRGQITIADLLLREGAIAVHAPHVPVDVRQNATVTIRLFIYMTLAVAGIEPHRTLIDAWRRTQSGNAVLDILHGNTHLGRWAQMRTPRGTPVLVDFMDRASVNRLRLNHAYRDTESVLLELAAEMGVEHEVQMWLRTPGYVPESAFYAFIGWPEQVFLQSPDLVFTDAS